jgi:ribose transport system permease protein
MKTTAKRWRANLSPQAIGVYAATVIIFVAFGVLNHNFLQISNLSDISISASIDATIGLGLTFVIITGGIDLSVGSTASLVGIVAANAMVNGHVAPAVAVVIGLVLGFVCGAINGILVTVFRLPPFIATLGTMGVYQGAAYLVTNGLAIYNVPQPFIIMLNGYLGTIPVMVIIVIVVAIICWLLLRRTVVGENVIATGGSEETAWLSGIRTARVKITVYALAGTLAGLAGMMLVARINTAQTEGGSPYLRTAIAAAVIGGANVMGGEGRIFGTLVGALILAALTNGLVLLNVSSFYEQIVTGLVVLIAVGLGQGTNGWSMLQRGPRLRRKVPAELPQMVDEPEMTNAE